MDIFSIFYFSYNLIWGLHVIMGILTKKKWTNTTLYYSLTIISRRTVKWTCPKIPLPPISTLVRMTFEVCLWMSARRPAVTFPGSQSVADEVPRPNLLRRFDRKTHSLPRAGADEKKNRYITPGRDAKGKRQSLEETHGRFFLLHIFKLRTDCVNLK